MRLDEIIQIKVFKQSYANRLNVFVALDVLQNKSRNPY